MGKKVKEADVMRDKRGLKTMGHLVVAGNREVDQVSGFLVLTPIHITMLCQAAAPLMNNE